MTAGFWLFSTCLGIGAVIAIVALASLLGTIMEAMDDIA